MKTTRILLAVVLALASCSSGGSGDGDADVSTGGLYAALEASTDVTSYRMTQATGQTITGDRTGMFQSVALDPADPVVVGSVTPDASYLEVDIGSALAVLGVLGQDVGDG